MLPKINWHNLPQKQIANRPYIREAVILRAALEEEKTRQQAVNVEETRKTLPVLCGLAGYTERVEFAYPDVEPEDEGWYWSTSLNQEEIEAKLDAFDLLKLKSLKTSRSKIEGCVTVQAECVAEIITTRFARDFGYWNIPVDEKSPTDIARYIWIGSRLLKSPVNEGWTVAAPEDWPKGWDDLRLEKSIPLSWEKLSFKALPEIEIGAVIGANHVLKLSIELITGVSISEHSLHFEDVKRLGREIADKMQECQYALEGGRWEKTPILITEEVVQRFGTLLEEEIAISQQNGRGTINLTDVWIKLTAPTNSSGFPSDWEVMRNYRQLAPLREVIAQNHLGTELWTELDCPTRFDPQPRRCVVTGPLVPIGGIQEPADHLSLGFTVTMTQLALQQLPSGKYEIVVMSFAGANTAVKAVWAALMANDKKRHKLWFGRKSYEIEIDGAKNHFRPTPISYPSGLVEYTLLHKQMNSQAFNVQETYFYVLQEKWQVMPISSFYAMLNRALAIPMQAHWAETLWKAGIERRLITLGSKETFVKTACWRISTDYKAWRSIIQAKLGTGELYLTDANGNRIIKPSAPSSLYPTTEEAANATEQTPPAPATFIPDTLPDDDPLDTQGLVEAGDNSRYNPLENLPRLEPTFELGRIFCTESLCQIVEAENLQLSPVVIAYSKGQWGG